jgi:hypothetical protein
LTFAQKEIVKLKNQLHQAKDTNMARERADRGSKGKKEGSQDDEVGSKRPRQQVKQARASKPGPSPPSPPLKGFKMLPTGEISDSDEEEDYPEQNVKATYAKALSCLIVFHLQMLCIPNFVLSQSSYMQPNRRLINTTIAMV